MSNFEKEWSMYEVDDDEKKQKYSDDENNDENDDNQEYGAEKGSYDRVSYEDDCGSSNIQIDGKLNDIYKYVKDISSVEDRFKNLVGAIAYKLDQDNIFKISQEMRNNMCRQVSSFTNTKYLNPLAYILGYIASNKGTGISKDNFNKVISKLPEIGDNSVKPEDVLRYARFCVNKF